MIIPLENNLNWVTVAFNKIPENQVNFGKQIEIKVNNSASPLIYKFEKPIKIKSFRLELEIEGDLKSAVTEDKSKWEEDSLFRLGLVASGDKKLTGLKKMFAASWVKKLFTLSPENQGLDKIYFYNLGRKLTDLGKIRIHPKSELMQEEIIETRNIIKAKLNESFNAYNMNKIKSPNAVVDNGSKNLIKFSKEFVDPKEIVALWVSVDGDDSKSSFSTFINKIEIVTIDP